MTVRKSLAQQEEYRVRDTDGDREPVTEAGREVWRALGRNAADGVRIRAIEDERSEEQAIPDPEPGTPATEAGRRFLRENGTSHVRLILAIEAEAALLARRAPGDRPGVHATPDSPRARRTPWGYTDDPAGSYVVLYDPLLADRALAADSRPEQQK